MSRPHLPAARRTAGMVALPLLAVALAASGCGTDSSEPSSDAGQSDARQSASGSPSAPGTSARADAAADWLLGQLEKGVLVGEFGADYGLTIDTALSLAALDGRDKDVAAVADTMTEHVASYTTGVDFGSADVYAGALAKATVLAQSAAEDPTDFGGVDLVERLEQRVADDGIVAGRLADEVTDPKGTDYANTIGQAYAVRALAAADSPEAGAATSYLLAQQCEEGFFRLYFAPADAPEQGCDAGDAKASPPDVDVTALAMLALAELEGDAQAETAVGSARAWLLEQQQEDGSFGGATSTEAPNANSTGLAGWALGVTGEDEAAEQAAGWLATQQITDQACDVAELAGEAGAVAYDDAALTAADKGLGKTRDQWRSATVQALPALRWAEESGDEGWQDC